MLRYEDVRWEVAACNIDGCPNDGELIWDGREVLCIDCADRILERQQIIAMYGRDSIENLPEIGEWHEVVRPFQYKQKEND